MVGSMWRHSVVCLCFINGTVHFWIECLFSHRHLLSLGPTVMELVGWPVLHLLCWFLTMLTLATHGDINFCSCMQIQILAHFDMDAALVQRTQKEFSACWLYFNKSDKLSCLIDRIAPTVMSFVCIFFIWITSA